MHTPLTPPNQVVRDITDLTSNALVRAMAKHPSERFETYDEFAMALEAARSHLLVGNLRKAEEEGHGDPNKGWWRL